MRPARSEKRGIRRGREQRKRGGNTPHEPAVEAGDLDGGNSDHVWQGATETRVRGFTDT